MPKDYYSILEVNRNANAEEIKSSYRNLAKKYHPDKNLNDKEKAEKKFKEISEAYDVLGDEQKKNEYDNPQSFQNINFDDIFNSHHFTRKRPRGIENINYELNISLEEFYNSKVKSVKINRRFQNRQTKLITNITETLEIPIKPWYKPGTKITFEKRGDDLINKPLQNLIFILNESNHNKFLRKNDELICNIEISVIESLVGFKKYIKTIDDELIEIDKDEISHPNKYYIIKNKGMPKKQGGYGDLIVKYIIKYPEVLNEEQRNSLKKIIL